jgi:hypothetical protein
MYITMNVMSIFGDTRCPPILYPQNRSPSPALAPSEVQPRTPCMQAPSVPDPALPLDSRQQPNARLLQFRKFKTAKMLTGKVC